MPGPIWADLKGMGAARPHDLATNLELGEYGIWFAKTDAIVSYPACGNEGCFAIEDRSFWFQHRNCCIASVVQAYPPAGAIFDLGGGNGFVSRELEKGGWETVVVEPGRAGAVNSRKRGLENVICATLESACFRPHTLPAAGLFDVLEHIADDEEFLRLLHERLAPGGRVYLTVPAYRWLWSAEDSSAGHFRRYTIPSLAAVLARAGFEVEFASYIFSPLPPPILLFRTIPSLLRLRKPDRAGEEHGGGSKTLLRVAGRVFDWEIQRLRRKKTIPAGGSCLVVARSRGC